MEPNAPPYTDPHYRVAIFGSARIQEHDPEYAEVFRLARELALQGFDVVTGGGPGLMHAANAGHKSAAGAGHSVGLNIKLPHEQAANRFLDLEQEFERFSERLDTFVSLSDAVVVAPGGVGTLLELFYAWQLMQVEHICETPIILLGSMWSGLLSWLRGTVLPRGLFSEGDLHSLFHVQTPEEAVSLIARVQADRAATDHVCRNYDRYRTAFTFRGG
ncbi:MAG: LOG family protein [Deferrisomatales bacterium]|nr:LOG family protein [Deferrisomatales bacterium]